MKENHMSDSIDRSYRFDPPATGGSTYFLLDGGDKAAYLEQPVFPPVGTHVSLPDGVEAEVSDVRLDLSNPSQLAMIYVSVKRLGGGEVWGV
jgi:hypothetical protein